ncbi:hypothetical protein SELMODRAFT_408499 [Selaginella moellendorffii]|uniref:Uncharacterized protein n=1 Tax=Selaginella moellendorffii TaxID=88036 RepID=D8R8H9_SELML|nr:hypothetical protein SELMODRAFT_408499 [Selaginella moellendorffii]
MASLRFSGLPKDGIKASLDNAKEAEAKTLDKNAPTVTLLTCRKRKILACSSTRYVMLKGGNNKFIYVQHQRGSLLEAKSQLDMGRHRTFQGTYQPIKLSDKVVTFRSTVNQKLCKRYSEYWLDSLCAIADSINDKETHLEYLLELAEMREIEALVVGRSYLKNNGDKTADLQAQRGRTYEFGKATQNAIQFQSTVTVKDFKQNGKVNVTFECTKAKCRIPFTYKTRSTRLDGVDLPATEEIDGIFEGVLVYNIGAKIGRGTKLSSEVGNTLSLEAGDVISINIETGETRKEEEWVPMKVTETPING